MDKKAKIVIENGIIVSAILFSDRKVTELDHTETEVNWGSKWQVRLDPTRLECISKRPCKKGGTNTLTYTVAHTGTASLWLTANGTRKNIRTTRAFTQPGNFDGTLELCWKGNGHRWATLQSTELISIQQDLGIQWLAVQSPEELLVDDRRTGIFCLQQLTDAGLTVYRSAKRRLVTDGSIRLENTDTKKAIRFQGASWVFYVKHHPNSGKDDCVLFTRENLFELRDVLKIAEAAAAN